MAEFSNRFSIIIATLNAERTIGMALSALRAQDYPSQLVEILVVDGGSKDRTREIAQGYGCRIVENPKIEPVSAKIIGLREAKGDYLIYCDADEVLENPLALKKRVLAFQHPGVHMVFAEGYKSPADAPFIRRFINEFGDPFSMFYYRLSKDCRFFPEDVSHSANLVGETSDFQIYEVDPRKNQPLMENAAIANAIDLAFFRKNFADLLDKPWGPVHFFYHMQTVTRRFAITKSDAVVHHSSDTWGGFLRKIRWRIANNIFSSGESGFLGREKRSSGNSFRKYLFVPYTLLLLPVLADSLRYVITRRDWRYLGIVPLCFFTIFWIAVYTILRVVGFRQQERGYGV